MHLAKFGILELAVADDVVPLFLRESEPLLVELLLSVSWCASSELSSWSFEVDDDEVRVGVAVAANDGFVRLTDGDMVLVVLVLAVDERFEWLLLFSMLTGGDVWCGDVGTWGVLPFFC